MLHEGTGCEPFDDSICEIPLYDKHGAVVARARVDPDDWFALARYRWCRSASGYAIGAMATQRFHREGGRGKRVGGANRKSLFMHRVVMGLAPGDRHEVDHINRDRLDNRRCNLRLANRHMQGQNQTPQKGRSSQYRGVAWDPVNRKWRAYAKLDGRHFALGRFIDEEEAAMAAAEFRAAHMPCSAEGTEAA